MTATLPLAAGTGPGGETAGGGAIPERLFLRSWADPVIDLVGYDPRSPYVERFWLPVLGPSTIWLLRRLASLLEERPGGSVVETARLARELGIGERTGPAAPFARTVKRCVDFQMARWEEPALAVRRRLPPLAQRHIRRLPDPLRQEHARVVSSSGPLDERLVRHGRRLAISLLDYGEDQAGAESQLARWGFEPALARQCATFAGIVMARRRAAASQP